MNENKTALPEILPYRDIPIRPQSWGWLSDCFGGLSEPDKRKLFEGFYGQRSGLFSGVVSEVSNNNQAGRLVIHILECGGVFNSAALVCDSDRLDMDIESDVKISEGDAVLFEGVFDGLLVGGIRFTRPQVYKKANMLGGLYFPGKKGVQK